MSSEVRVECGAVVTGDYSSGERVHEVLAGAQVLRQRLAVEASYVAVDVAERQLERLV
jgi:hypothetical protein